MSRSEKYRRLRVGVAVLAVSIPFGLFAEEAPEATVEFEGPVDIEESREEDLQGEESPEEESETDVDGVLDDAEGSIDDVEEKKKGLTRGGDIRASFVYEDPFIGVDISELLLRWRLSGSWGITERTRLAGRVAGIVSTDELGPEFILQPNLPTPTTIEDGQITFDEMFVHWFHREEFDLAAGRMQTKFVARGGVYAKSLDRNDSNNMRVNWTDGVHGRWMWSKGWSSHLILQFNSSDGPSTVRYRPLDFSDSGSRVTTFAALENNEPNGYLLQRGFDISYLPNSLLKDGTRDGRLEDYWGFVGRMAGRWPARSEGPRLRVSSEIGYAPQTQTQAAAGLEGRGDAGGLAWNVTVSVMDFQPTHSLGINYGRTEAGWLLSPQYPPNEELCEIRYLWRKNSRLAVEIRGRWREDLEKRTISDRKRDAFDLYIRFTWGFRSTG